jgi:hypothetical protein
MDLQSFFFFFYWRKFTEKKEKKKKIKMNYFVEGFNQRSEKKL